MTTTKINIEIWKEILKYCTKLSYDERAALHRAIEDILENNQQSTPGLDRIMALENKLDRQSLLVADALSDVNNHAVQIETLTDDTNKTHVLTVAVGRIVDGHTGQIAELTEQVGGLKSSLESLANSHFYLRKCVEDFATNVYKELK